MAELVEPLVELLDPGLLDDLAPLRLVGLDAAAQVLRRVNWIIQRVARPLGQVGAEAGSDHRNPGERRNQHDRYEPAERIRPRRREGAKADAKRRRRKIPFHHGGTESTEKGKNSQNLMVFSVSSVSP